MNSNDSPKPSDTSARRPWYRPGRRTLIEIAVIIAVFIALSLWLSRHMLQREAPAPELNLPMLHNNSMAQLQWPSEAERTLVYFFAPWCSVCRVSMPGLNLLTDDERLRVVAIALSWEEKTAVEDFIRDTGFRGEVLLGTPETQRQYQVSGYPSYYVIDRNGRILHADRGLSTPPGLWLRTHF